MSRLLNDPFSAIVLGIVIAGFLYAMYYQLKVRIKGIETTAYVTWIEEVSHADSDGMRTTYDVHVVYVNRRGKQTEGVISNPVFGVQEGDQLRIKYLESNPEFPVCISKM